MDFTDRFVDLYKKVLEKKTRLVSEYKIREAIQAMKEVYLPNSLWQENQVLSVALYKEASYHCAYLHKYAMLHSGMVCDILQTAIKSSPEIHNYINSKRRLTLCSLGGGPGTDAIGALAAIFACCQYIPCTVNILDYYSEWRETFDLIIQEIRNSDSKGLKSMVSSQFQWGYGKANLLEDVAKKASVQEIVKAADFLMMVKFISAAACKTTSRMVKNIFNCMKPGAMLLFIDNAAGGFHQMMQAAANECEMVTVFGPRNHYEYENAKYSIKKFHYTSQSKTKVSVQIWKKKQANPYNTTQDLRNNYNVRQNQQPTRFIPQAPVNVTVRPNREEERQANDGSCSII